MTIWNRETRFEGTTINVSEGGIYFFAAADLNVGDAIEMEFRLSYDKEPVRTCGVVCRRALYLYGVEFAGDGDMIGTQPISGVAAAINRE